MSIWTYSSWEEIHQFLVLFLLVSDFLSCTAARCRWWVLGRLFCEGIVVALMLAVPVTLQLGLLLWLGLRWVLTFSCSSVIKEFEQVLQLLMLLLLLQTLMAWRERVVGRLVGLLSRLSDFREVLATMLGCWEILVELLLRLVQLLIHLLGWLHLLILRLWVRWEGCDVAKVWMIYLLRASLILIVRIKIELLRHLAWLLLRLLCVWVREIVTFVESWWL